MRIISARSPLNSNEKLGTIKLMSSKLALPLVSVVFFLLVVAGFMLVKPRINLPSGSSLGSVTEGIKASGYQAVFLANGQVYFGRLRGFSTNEPVLTDVYYLKVGTTLQPGEASKQQTVAVEKETAKTKAAKAPAAKQATPPAMVTKQTLTLVKMGAEVHGPTGELKLNRDQILFVENLREDSKVVEAINKSRAASASK